MIKMIEKANKKSRVVGVKGGGVDMTILMFVIIQLIEFDKKDIIALLLVLSIHRCDFFWIELGFFLNKNRFYLFICA
jgi:hypothetical protein